ncbi:MAG: hypothetical protein Q8Q20_03145, partial [bacterium]|nr:hypothetical protein [bacterium]
LANVLLIIVLLFIAWGTVMRLESYHYKRTIPKFVLMAFLINFSKSISGFFIDIAQVIMNTFTRSFAESAYGALTSGTGITDILSFSEDAFGTQVQTFDVAVALIFGVFLLTILIGAVIGITIIFLGRILMLWILVILSPLAYFAQTLDTMKSFANQWWKQFGQSVIVGPILAFFLWLGLTVMVERPGTVGQEISDFQATNTVVNVDAADNEIAVTISNISRTDNLLSFIVSVGLLYAAMMIAQQMKPIGGAFAMKMASGVSGGLLKAPYRAFDWSARKIKSGSLSIPGAGPRFQRMGRGLELNPVNVYRNIKKGMESKRQTEEAKGAMFADERLQRGQLVRGLGAPSFVDNYMQDMFYSRGFKTALSGWRLKRNQGKLTEKQDELSGINKDIEKSQQGIIKGKEPELETIKNTLRAKYPRMDEKKVEQKAIETLGEKYGDDSYKHLMETRGETKGSIQKLQQAVQLWQSRRPKDFIGQQLRRALISQEAKKIETTNEDELISQFQGATERGDIPAAMALTMTSAKVGHLNELVKASKATENYYEHLGVFDETTGKYKVQPKGFINEKEYQKYVAENNLSPDEIKQQFEKGGNPVFKPGQYLSSGRQGTLAMFHEVFLKKMKLNDQTTWALANDASNTAEAIGHWNVGQLIGTDAAGRNFPRAKVDQQMRVKIETAKQDLENYLRRTNRLAEHDEVPINPYDNTEGHEGKLNEVGVQFYVDRWPNILSSLTKDRFNESKAFHTVNYNWHLMDQGLIETEVRENVENEVKDNDEMLKKWGRLKKEEKTRYSEGGKWGEAESFDNFKRSYVADNMKKYEEFKDLMKKFAGGKAEAGKGIEDKLRSTAEKLAKVKEQESE